MSLPGFKHSPMKAMKPFARSFSRLNWVRSKRAVKNGNKCSWNLHFTVYVKKVTTQEFGSVFQIL